MNAEPIAAELGRLAAAGPPAPDDHLRLTLVDAIVAANAAGALDQAGWQGAFDAAARAEAAWAIAAGTAELRRAASSARYPARRLKAVLPNAEAVEILLNRMLAEGIGLEQLEDAPASPAARRTHAGALEAAWEGVRRLARTETARYRIAAGQIVAWRRPTTALWIGSAVVLAAAILVAAWLGGQLPAPGWFRPFGAFWWNLPWP